MKTVIHVWTHNFNINNERLKKYNYLNETNFYFGLGDLIRSSIKLYELSKILNFNYIIDIQLHPISNFLNVVPHQYSEHVLKNKDNVDYVCYGEVDDYIQSHGNSDIMLILTNDFYGDGKISDDCKRFIQNIFIPNNRFNQFIQNKLSTIPFEHFNILHYRINDNSFLGLPNSEESNYYTYLSHLRQYKEKNDILISDTKSLKKYVFMNDDIFMFDTKVCHLGLSTDLDEIRDTLFELFLLINSKKIKTMCKIHTVSGFVQWIGKIYDIPVISLNVV